ncbi:hypothetical protein Glove_349g131 [Diversispora epigaea]|uniref:Uncharacterized protein n=1 Tax=Diversispora epigaea TaxID=1348612 RepID=A0A397HDL9_9GLOM|nr:hypothetical protein Glove_349g131 [Diversispora epigaea]
MINFFAWKFLEFYELDWDNSSLPMTPFTSSSSSSTKTYSDAIRQLRFNYNNHNNNDSNSSSLIESRFKFNRSHSFRQSTSLSGEHSPLKNLSIKTSFNNVNNNNNNTPKF